MAFKELASLIGITKAKDKTPLLRGALFIAAMKAQTLKIPINLAIHFQIYTNGASTSNCFDLLRYRRHSVFTTDLRSMPSTPRIDKLYPKVNQSTSIFYFKSHNLLSNVNQITLRPPMTKYRTLAYG